MKADHTIERRSGQRHSVEPAVRSERTVGRPRRVRIRFIRLGRQRGFRVTVPGGTRQGGRPTSVSASVVAAARELN
jgi:hypothetical protein